MNSFHKEFYNFYELQRKYEEKTFRVDTKNCYVVVSLQWKAEKNVYMPETWKSVEGEYNHSGDDGKEVPPVPIPNTEVKLFYAESTCRLLPGG